MDSWALGHLLILRPSKLISLSALMLYRGKLLSKSTPVRIASITERVISIAAGGNHSLICTKAGKIYSCGDNSKGQLGTGDNRSSVAFTQLKDMDGIKVSEVKAGNQHSA